MGLGAGLGTGDGAGVGAGVGVADGAGVGTVDGAGDGGVHDRDALGRLIREFLHEFATVGREISPYRAGAQRGQRPTCPHHAIDVVGAGE